MSNWAALTFPGEIPVVFDIDKVSCYCVASPESQAKGGQTTIFMSGCNITVAESIEQVSAVMGVDNVRSIIPEEAPKIVKPNGALPIWNGKSLLQTQ